MNIIETLTEEQKAEYKADAEALKQAPTPGLESRLQWGLDPAAMMEVPGVKNLVENILETLAPGEESTARWQRVRALTEDLHKNGPWNHAEDLKAATKPEIKAYLLLAAACGQRKLSGPLEYLMDKVRVQTELSTFVPEAFAQRISKFEKELQVIEMNVQVNDRSIKVPLAQGDPALALAMRGYHGCVVKGGDLYFVQATEITDDVLHQEGLEPGYGETFDAKVGTQVRVPLDTKGCRIVWVKQEELSKSIEEQIPAIKRIGKGYVLTYGNQHLALQIAGRVLEPYATETK